MKKFVVLIGALVAVSMLGCGHKKGYKRDGQKHHKMWQKMDADGDGAVTREEFDKAHAEKFEAMDADKDGKVTMEEKKAYKKSKKKGCKSCK